ncbi:hypothetical protein SAMN05444358_101181 [Ruegeria halocynthiae]|uniref:Uncharacterized protein n=1 Tax=Ruegeria halocynthiae TaxID=985054 RepID=A0A1H2RIS9_9RHOB|nr:hypothetical protein [Ruegeria halocynthiae]SDW19382.1 hypothetical protein SAMN05444358_101181 [Ruegeria halocynthiae]
METQFTKLNEDWNADPNAPIPVAAPEGDDLWLRFRPNEWVNPSRLAHGCLFIKFEHCWRYRFTSVNDHGWFAGQCRFSKMAPDWGEFYEVVGDFLGGKDTTPWETLDTTVRSERNFLFYFRDGAVECSASSWSLNTEVPAGLIFDGGT